MIYSQILLGTILIVCGFLVKKYPNLIAGYNTMSQAEKEKVNINALSSFLKLLLIGLGLLTIIIYGVLKLATINDETVYFVNTGVVLFGIVLGLIYVNTNKKFKN